MNSIVNNMPKYDHRQHVLSDWLAELDQRFQLGEVGEDKHKITWCQLLIGATGSSILSGLEDDASRETAKETLLSRPGIGSVKDEAWAALKTFKKGSKEIVELAGEVEKLAKRLHPRYEEAAERLAIEVFLSALERPLAAEVQKLGYHTMESVVAAARRIEKILAAQTDSEMERLMQNQIRLLKKDLKDAREQFANPTAALTANPAPTVAAAQPPPPAPARPPPPAPTRSSYQEYPEENPHYSPPHRQSDRRSPCCFLCGEEGHLDANCPVRPALQHLLHQQTHAGTRGPPQGQFSESSPTKDGSQIPPNIPVRLLEGSSKAKVTPVGCAVGPPITGQLTLEGIPVHGIVGTGASVTCMGFSLWWQYHAQWGPLKPFKEVVCGAHGKPLQIAVKTQHLDLQWGEARGRVCFVVIMGLESLPCLIGMDIMRPLRVRIDVTNGTATPTQPDPQTVHLSAAQQQQKVKPPRDATPQLLPSQPQEIAPPPATPHTASRALLLQTADIPVETARLVRCHNPWPAEDVYFCPEDTLPAFVTGVPTLSSGSELWIAIHNHRPEPLRLHSGQNIGVLEVVTVADAPSSTSKPGPLHQPPMPKHLSPLQQQQLNGLFKEFSDVFSQGEDDLGCTPLLEHTNETHGPPLRQPYRRQNLAVRREEMAQVQQMLASDVIRPSNSPWALPVVMVKKKDGSLHFCVDFCQLNAATVKDAHPLPRTDDLLDALHGACWFSTLDLKSGYWQVPIMERDKEKTAFRASSGQLYEFNQVPFGLCNTPSTFSRLMDCVLSGLHWETCLFYLDNIIVFSST